ncbi:hypothetical protein [Pedococcus sp. P5_B7]
METLIAVLGTLAGTAFGAIATFVTQRASFARESTERLRETRRVQYVEFMAKSHDVFLAIRTLAAAGRQRGFATEGERLDMRGVPAAEGQKALEELRLVCDDEVAARAADLWLHLRKEHIPRGAKHNHVDFNEWSTRYWALRRELINTCRAEAGMQSLDWEKASVAGREPGKADQSSTLTDEDDR